MAMFNSKDSAKNGTASNRANQFVEGTVIHGEIQSANDIRVDGTIVGTVKCSSKISVGGNGRIDGDIQCQNADIEGKVVGGLEIKELLFLRSTAIIEGDIVANKLVVEEGAKFNGTCSMGAKPKQVNKHDKKVEATLEKEAI